jgi:hypothetical protein
VLSIISEDGSAAHCLGLPVLSGPGDAKLVPSEADARTLPLRWAVGGGVFAGDDFCGEIDLARSGEIDKLSVLHPRQSAQAKL